MTLGNGFKVVQPGGLPLASDVNQLQQAFTNIGDAGTLQLVSPVVGPTLNGGNVVVSGTGGSMGAGAYIYKTAWITGFIDSNYNYYINGFAPSNEYTVTTVSGGSVQLTVPAFPAGAIAWAFYRTSVGGATGTEQFGSLFPYSSGGYMTDTLPDGSLGHGILQYETIGLGGFVMSTTYVPAAVPTTNTTGTTLALSNCTTLPSLSCPAGTILTINSRLFLFNGLQWMQIQATALTNYQNWI